MAQQHSITSMIAMNILIKWSITYGDLTDYLLLSVIYVGYTTIIERFKMLQNVCKAKKGTIRERNDNVLLKLEICY